RSSEQHHGWNFPFQLTRLPPTLSRYLLQDDHCTDCDTYAWEVQDGDLLLVFSDGVRDNLHDADTDIEHRGPHRAPGAGGPGGSAGEHATPPERVARALASAARLRSVDPAARVPFNIYSRRHGLERTGGKEDPGTTSRSWQPGCCPSATAAPSRPSTPRGPCSSPPPACPAWPAPGPTSEAAGRPCASAWPGLPRARREAHRHHRRIHPNPSWDRVVWQLSSAHARAALSRSSSSSSSPPPLPFPLPHPSVVAGAFCFWLGPGFKQPMRVSTVFGNHAA
ncbi:unnamed protein product, partial [Prorocentrum cordatum]